MGSGWSWGSWRSESWGFCVKRFDCRRQSALHSASPPREPRLGCKRRKFEVSESELSSETAWNRSRAVFWAPYGPSRPFPVQLPGTLGEKGCDFGCFGGCGVRRRRGARRARPDFFSRRKIFPPNSRKPHIPPPKTKVQFGFRPGT